MSVVDFKKLNQAYKSRASDRSCEEDSDKESQVIGPSVLDELEARIKSLRSAADQTSETEQRIKRMEDEIARLESEKLSQSYDRISKEHRISQRIRKKEKTISGSSVERYFPHLFQQLLSQKWSEIFPWQRL
jgi:predicted RNase H-like nuclease (RuvC/YqgF family)